MNKGNCRVPYDTMRFMACVRVAGKTPSPVKGLMFFETIQAPIYHHGGKDTTASMISNLIGAANYDIKRVSVEGHPFDIVFNPYSKDDITAQTTIIDPYYESVRGCFLIFACDYKGGWRDVKPKEIADFRKNTLNNILFYEVKQ